MTSSSFTKTPMDRKLMLCLCLSPMDKSLGVQALRLWTDLEDAFNQQITVAVCLRFDMTIDEEIRDAVSYASSKFKMLTHISKRKAAGWPAGCNALEMDAYEWFVESNRNKMFDFEYMMIIEADTVPLRKGWANEIMNEAYDSKAKILGCMLMHGDCGCEHINGNCVIHRDTWRENKAMFHCCEKIGWDAKLGPFAVSRGVASRLIWQDYRLGAPDNPWKGDEFLFADKFYKSPRSPLYGQPIRAALVHGVKTMDGINAVRKKYSIDK